MAFVRCFRALCRRNLIYRRRRWISTLFEFALPIAAFGILVGIKKAVENTDSFAPKVVEAKYPTADEVLRGYSFLDYLTALQADKICVVPGLGPTGYSVSGLDPYNNPTPFVRCDSRQCQAPGESALPYCEYSILALAPSSGDDVLADERVDAFMDYLGDTYPQLLDASNFPFQHLFVQKFDSSDEIEAYVTHEDYGKTLDTTTMPKIGVAVVFDSTSGDENEYNYVIRVNSTGYNSPENDGRPASRTTPSTARLFDGFAKTPEAACSLDGGSPSPGYSGSTCAGQYLYNGALTVQRMVDDYIIDATGAAQNGAFVAENGVSFGYFPEPSYVEEGFYGFVAAFVPLLVVLGLLYPIASCIRSVVQEKEYRQKELMKMMSVSEAAIGWSWFVSLYGFLLLSGVCTAAVSTKLYSNSDFVLLFIFWLFVLLGSLMFAFVTAAFFSKATRATLVGILLYFAGYFLTLALDFSTDSPGLIFLVSLHPVTSFSYGLQLIGELEDKGVGLTWSTLAYSDYPSGYTFSNAMASLIFDCLLWGILTWYTNRVVPGDFGTPQPFYFLFTRAYWCPGRVRAHATSPEASVDASGAASSSIPIEPVSEALKKQNNKVQICGLTKSFGQKVAVDGLNLSMYSGQVTALLGHNGAGKSTTIAMLTGMLAPTSGYATVAGLDIRGQMPLIREKMGICLQHDCLFPLLTVTEHIEFFSRIKGVYQSMSRADAKASVQTSIEDVALMEKRNTLSKDLSGGMKRKLSVAIAFCGNSSVVALDEPTSGMDPFSRRFVWNLIRQYRENRCIILTTHFMDEADLLGDRIAIMSEGQLRCVGSSLFLKKQFGVGYNLTVEKMPPAKTDNEQSEQSRNNKGSRTRSVAGNRVDARLIDIVTGAVREASLLSNVGNEISFQLPIDSSERFPDMFSELDEMVDDNTISTYGVGITTLDEVFLMVARGETGKAAHMESAEASSSPLQNGRSSSQRSSSSKNGQSTRSLESTKSHSHTGASSRTSIRSEKSFRPENLEGSAAFSRHVQALFAKRATNFKRDKKAWCCSTICPSLFALIGFLIVGLVPTNRNLPAAELTLDMNNPEAPLDLRNPIPFNEAGGEFSCSPGTCIGVVDSSGSATGESYYFCGESAQFGRDTSSCTDEGYCGPNCTITDSDTYVSAVTDDGSFPVPQNVSGINETSFSLEDTAESFAATQYGALYFTHDMISVVDTETGSGDTFADSAYGACITKEQDYTDPSQCTRFEGIGYTVSTNFTSLHATILYQSVADEAIIRSATQNDQISINPTIHPLPITSVELSYVSGEDAFTAWFLLVVSFPFIAGSVGTFVVAERQSKAKHLQTVSGVKPSAYWLSTYFWDAINYQLPLWIVIILMYATGLEAFTTNERGVASGTIVLLFLFGPAAAGFTYCVSFAFKSPSMCNLFMIIFGFLIGMVPAIVVFILRLIAADPFGELEYFLTIAQAIEWVLRPFPPFNLAKGLLFIINIETFSIIYAAPDLTVWSPEIILYEVIFLSIEFFAYVWLAIWIDVSSNKPSRVLAWRKFVRMMTCRCFCSGRKEDRDAVIAELSEGHTEEIDDDVAQETDRVLAGAAAQENIVIQDITKVYENRKRAVDHLSLGVPSGECFGLLGINGAGKTTTMAVLTAEFPPTSGDVFLGGYSVTNQPEQTRHRIGYCPQFDAHFMNMTGREHVELYASIKGVPKTSVKAAAAAKLAQVGLSKFDSDRLSANYSGGMKRKLSVACATIGEPSCVLLDEPSTGMDPVARRDLWKVISNMVSGERGMKTSVILTTHSMEECEALCPRIGIMAGGMLRCLGSAQRLKSKFGQGFQVEAKVKAVLPEDADYQAVLSSLLNHIQADTFTDEAGVESGDLGKGKDTFVRLDEALGAVQAVTGNSDIMNMIAEDSPIGYVIYKHASSDIGVGADELAVFCVEEMRIEKLQAFFSDTFSVALLRERQESKVRYEVSSDGLRISSVFGSIENNKEKLQLSDYGVSQTSLEQIFNFFAAEAEERKRGQNDG
mmetsp:Transcript_38849/g.85269  ORF Transcript_38849/g.85269 Transcript_38849/m.85269 type:complete len:2010 (+) Transcript_38849:258-6287(+)